MVENAGHAVLIDNIAAEHDIIFWLPEKGIGGSVRLADMMNLYRCISLNEPEFVPECSVGV